MQIIQAIYDTLSDMRILIYKRTHKGDPDERGIFGCQDCMGRIRDWEYDAVIGIGGKSTQKGHAGISYKVNWVGIGPKRRSCNGRAHQIVFDHFELYEDAGDDIRENYPKLSKYMYESRKRFSLFSDLQSEVWEDIKKILAHVKNNSLSLLHDASEDSEDGSYCPDSPACGHSSDCKTACMSHRKC